MPDLLDRVPRGSKVLLIRIRSMGDCVLTTPALRLLKQHRPDLQIGVVVEPRFAGVFGDNPDVAQILEPRTSATLAFDPHLILNFHGGTRSMALTRLSRARYRAGFAHHAGSCMYNIAIPRAQEILGIHRKVHTAEHLASAMFYLGVPQQEIPRALLYAPDPPPGHYAVLHPFASAPDKAWPAERFAALAEHLRSTGRETVIIAGPDDDVSPFSGSRILKAAPLREVKSLLKGAQFFAGNDSGPAHMAAAFGLRMVVLFGASDPVIWAPWRVEAETIISETGLAAIPVEQVIDAANRQMQREVARG
jgi:ADP-heptose:LPS heptosyltransferase